HDSRLARDFRRWRTRPGVVPAKVHAPGTVWATVGLISGTKFWRPHGILVIDRMRIGAACWWMEDKAPARIGGPGSAGLFVASQMIADKPVRRNGLVISHQHSFRIAEYW